MMTDLAGTVSPSSKLTWCSPPADDRDGPGRLLDAGAELLRLQLRARGQFLAGQARGKAQEVLDPR
jgi:hypothetical protein